MDSSPHPWHPFTLPPNTQFITIVTDWLLEAGVERHAIFAVFRGDYSFETLPQGPYASWNPWEENTAFRDLIPQVTATSCARLHINLWLMHGKAPSKEQSVTVTRVQYQQP